MAAPATDLENASFGDTVAAPDATPAGGPQTVLPAVEQQGGRTVLVPRTEDRYCRERVLGEGGMGVVELARDADIGRPVAIKRLRSPGSNAHSVARFVEEVRTIGALDHPGIAPVHDVGVDAEGALFFVMKYVEGQTLEAIIEQLREGDADAHRAYPIGRRMAIFASLLHTIDYAHSRGLLHRDLKPANVLIGPYGEVLLVDWGIARPIGDEAAEPIGAGFEGGQKTSEASETNEAPGIVTGAKDRLVSTHAGAVIGTPLYMSPEQARGETDTLDARSDLYSAAMLLFELLTLHHPLEAHDSVAAICTALQVAEPPGNVDSCWEPPGQEPVPAEVRHFLRKALSNDREGRWGSAAEMLTEVEAIRDGNFRVQCPVTFLKRVQHRNISFIERHPGMALLGVLGTVTLFLGSATGFLYLLLGS